MTQMCVSMPTMMASRFCSVLLVVDWYCESRSSVYMLKAVLSMLAITLFPVWLSLGAMRDRSSETVSPRRALFWVVM